MDIGFIGLGQMGAGMAASLLNAGHHVTVYNRSPDKAKPLVAQGAEAAGSVADACRGEVVFTMLADDDAVAGVTFGDHGILASLREGGTHVSSSTISVALSERLTLFNAPVYKTYGGLIANEKFEPPGFAAPLGQKDIRLALEAAEQLRVPLPIASLVRDRFLTLLANGGEHLDWSALGVLPAWEAGTASLTGAASLKRG
jgi:3-hydroxyisobutyrate dehydrogenase-like beta-hydroxyacid dehydrogenase